MHVFFGPEDVRLQAKSKNFQDLALTLNSDITDLGFKMERKNTIQCLSGLRIEDQ